MSEPGVYLFVARARNHSGKFTHLGGGENNVGGYSGHDGFRLDAREGGRYSTASASDVVRVERIENGDIGVCIEAATEFFSLVALV